MQQTRCDLCEADDALTLYAGASWRQPVPEEVALVRCQACGLMYLNPRPSPDEIDAYYPAEYGPFGQRSRTSVTC